MMDIKFVKLDGTMTLKLGVRKKNKVENLRLLLFVYIENINKNSELEDYRSSPQRA